MIIYFYWLYFGYFGAKHDISTYNLLKPKIPKE